MLFHLNTYNIANKVLGVLKNEEAEKLDLHPLEVCACGKSKKTNLLICILTEKREIVKY